MLRIKEEKVKPDLRKDIAKNYNIPESYLKIYSMSLWALTTKEAKLLQK